MMIGIAMGNFSLREAILAVPLCFIGATLFAALGLLVAAKSRTIEEISYPQYLLVFRMFSFLRRVFPLRMLPAYLQWWLGVSRSLPRITHPDLTPGTPLQPQVNGDAPF